MRAVEWVSMAGLRSGNGEPSMSAFVRKPVVKGAAERMSGTAPISGTVGGRERSGPLRSAVRFLHFAEGGQH